MNIENMNKCQTFSSNPWMMWYYRYKRYTHVKIGNYYCNSHKPYRVTFSRFSVYSSSSLSFHQHKWSENGQRRATSNSPSSWCTALPWLSSAGNRWIWLQCSALQQDQGPVQAGSGSPDCTVLVCTEGWQGTVEFLKCVSHMGHPCLNVH